jgi:hypothetical protein
MPETIYGRKLALLTRRRDGIGSETVHLDTGIVAFTQCELLLDRGLGKRPFRLRSEWMSRLESVGGALRDSLGDADVMLSLGAGELSDQELSTLL